MTMPIFDLLSPDQCIFIYSPIPSASAKLVADILENFKAREILTNVYYAHQKDLNKKLNVEDAYSMVIAHDVVPLYTEEIKIFYQIGTIVTFSKPIDKTVLKMADHIFEYSSKMEFKEFRSISVQAVEYEEDTVHNTQ